MNFGQQESEKEGCRSKVPSRKYKICGKSCTSRIHPTLELLSAALLLMKNIHRGKENEPITVLVDYQLVEFSQPFCLHPR